MQSQQKEGNNKDQSSNKQNTEQKNNRKAMKPKVGSLKKINKIVKLLAIWTKEKIEEIQMTKKKKKITTNCIGEKRIIKQYLQLYINKLDNLDKNFLETQSLPRSKHEEIENLNRPTTSKGIELEIQNLPTKKSPGPDGFTGKFHQRFQNTCC